MSQRERERKRERALMLGNRGGELHFSLIDIFKAKIINEKVLEKEWEEGNHQMKGVEGREDSKRKEERK